MRQLSLFTVAFWLALSGVSSLKAASVVWQTDFEGLALGALVGQAQWQAFPNTYATGAEVVGLSSGSGQRAVALSASQLDPNGRSYFYQNNFTQATLPQEISVSFDLKIDATTLASRSDWAVALVDANTRFLLTMGINRQGQLIFTSADEPFSVLPQDIGFTLGEWHRLSATANFRTSEVTYRLDGRILTTPTAQVRSDASAVSELDLVGAFAGTDVAFFDNIVISQAIPEPTVIALSLGTLFLGLRRHRVGC